MRPSERKQSKDSSSVPLGTSSESSGRLGRHDKVLRFLGEVKNANKRISGSKDSLDREPVLPNIDESAPSIPNIEVQDTSVDQGADPQSAPQNAEEPAKPMKVTRRLSARVASLGLPMPLSGRVKFTPLAQNSLADLGAANNFQDTYIPLKKFENAVGTLMDVHPYTKIALGMLSRASKIVLDQTDHDEAVLELLKQLGRVYDFMMQDETLCEIPSMQIIVGRIVQQTLECSQFIRDYSAIKYPWKRFGSETDRRIQKYIDVFQELMDDFKHRTLRDDPPSVHRTGDSDLSGITYAEGAGLNPGKQCLPGTCIEILSKITDWANSTQDNAQRVLWLSGPAGKGKSVIAHTIANWFNNVGGLGSCYCFDRQQDADRRHEKIFFTIARDLADRDPEVKRALADAVQHTSALKNTTDIIQQWHELLVEPLGKLSGLTEGPVLIVIEALDESGGPNTRHNLLRIMAGKLSDQGSKITDLPPNFRILVTSRPLPDIKDEFDGAQHILPLSMDDIPPEVVERDIHTYVSEELKELSDFQEKQIAMLVAQADGLFEWARRACEYIKTAPGTDAILHFDAIRNRDPGLLYEMYRLILAQTQDQKPEALAMFRSVMAQILGTAEPLSLISLNAMRGRIPDQSEHYKAEVIVKHMGSLFSGTTNSSTPIKPIHTSFHEFLTDQASSGDFFIDMSKAQRDLTFASLRMMEYGLRFNLCDLKSSYLLNREDHELQERVNSSIPPHLSYSCRFWSLHLRATDFDTELANEVKSFFDHERLLFWLEVLGIIQAISSAVTALPHIAQWLKDHSGYEEVSGAAMDVHRFIQTFGGIILHSTPHLYVSALSFSPVESAVSKFVAKFPNTLRLASGHDLNWSAVQSLLGEYADKVLSVSFSPDGTRVVTGSADKTVRLWSAATGQPVGEPLRGHTGAVKSVSFSPDGTRIASGSYDRTLRLWDVASGQPVGEPLRGHTSWVNSVSFSPNGTCIVSGSSDNTVQLWEAATGKPIGEPLRGHTAWVNSASFSPDSIHIVSGSDDQTVRLWDVAMRRSVGVPLRGHTGAITSVSFSPDGTRITSGSYDQTIRLWDTTSGQPIGEPLQGHTAWVNSVSFSPNGTRIVSGSSDNTVRLWEVATGKQIGEPFQGHTGGVGSASFSPDGSRIVSSSVDDTVRLWQAAILQPLQEYPKQDYSTSSSGTSHTMHATNDNIMSTNTWNNCSICFSLDPNHALCNPAELMEGASYHDDISTSFSLGADGWMVGPDHRLLFWVPPTSRHSFNTPWTTLVMDRRPTDVDLSRMAHGKHWQKCRDELCDR